jgi:carbonic anhydrase
VTERETINHEVVAMTRILKGMTKIVDGVRLFQQQVFGPKEAQFRQLGKGQSPLVLFITCSDSRINPNLLTQTEPGELFILRNAGNIVPPHGAGAGGEEATIEYAVAHLKVRHIVVCGHSGCGAMHGLLAPEAVADMPAVARWLTFAQAVVPQVRTNLAPQEQLRRAIEQNTLVQLEHLKTHPAVAAALAAGALKLHAWVYGIAAGEVEAHDPASQRFVPLAERHARLHDRAPTPSAALVEPSI